MAPDVRVANEGNIFMLEFCSDRAKAWQEEFISTESWQWLGSRLAVDHRFAVGVVEAMQRDGLSVV